MGQPHQKLVSSEIFLYPHVANGMLRDDHAQTLSQIQLFLVDEVSHLLMHCSNVTFWPISQVHILNESRGSTLEVVISRMKLRGSGVRFVLVSATVPNIDDVAAWIENSSNGSAQIFEVTETVQIETFSAKSRTVDSSEKNTARAN